MYHMAERILIEMNNINHCLTQRIKELAERYETPLPRIEEKVGLMESNVKKHLQKMGFEWK